MHKQRLRQRIGLIFGMFGGLRGRIKSLVRDL